MNLKTYIYKIIKSEEKLQENRQLADKLYFNTGLLDQADEELIMSITNGNNYTKLIADIVNYLNADQWLRRNKTYDYLSNLYQQITSYDKNVIPLEDFSNVLNVKNIGTFIEALEKRGQIVDELKTLPSIAIRNLKDEIRTKRGLWELSSFLNSLEYLTTHLGYLTNRDEETKTKIYQKIFKKGATLDQITNFVDDKSNLFGGQETSVEEILSLVNGHYDMTLLHNKNNVLLVRIESAQAIKDIGCNSLWCFTYGSGFSSASSTWNNYSTDGIVYVIINFNVPQSDVDFMNVVIKPINFRTKNEEANDEKIYDLSNEYHSNPLDLLQRTLGLSTAKRLLTFDF